MGLGVCAVGVFVVLIGIGAVGDTESSVAPPSLDVRLPEEAEGELSPSLEMDLPEEGTGQLPPSEVQGLRPAESLQRGLNCSPEPCEVWRLELPDGVTAVDGDIYHLSRTDRHLELTALSGKDGAVLWRELIVEPPAPNGAPSSDREPAILTILDEVVVVATDGSLQARSRRDGQLVWDLQRHDWLPKSVVAGPPATILITASLVSSVRGETPGAPREAIAVLDIGTGNLRWEREVDRTLSAGLEPDAPLLVLQHDGSSSGPADREERPATSADAAPAQNSDQLIALDPTSGEERWRRDLPGDSFRINESVIQIRSSGWLEVWDAQTGDTLMRLRMPDSRGNVVDVEVHGHLLVRRFAGVGRRGADGEVWRQQLEVIDARDGHEILAATVVVDSVPVVPLRSGGVAILSGTGATVTVTALTEDGNVAWEREFGLPASSWPRWQDVDDSGALVLLTASEVGASDLVARRIDPVSGADLAIFPIDIGIRPAAVDKGSLEAGWPVVAQHGPSNIRFHGPAGRLEVEGDVRSLTTDPMTVTSPGGVIVRLDERLLLSDG